MITTLLLIKILVLVAACSLMVGDFFTKKRTESFQIMLLGLYIAIDSIVELLK